MTSNTPRPRRTARIRYSNDDTDSDDFNRFIPSSRPPRAARHIRTYRESSADSTEYDSSHCSESDADVAVEQTKTPKASLGDVQPRKRKRHHSTSLRVLRSTPFSTFKKQKIRDPSEAPRRTGSLVKADQFSTPKGSIPPWQQLPYQIIVSIMQHAAYPLYEKASRPSPSIIWLCATSTMCRSFHEACIAALLYSPPLFPSVRAHGLLNLLTQDQDTLMIDYRSKIKYLDIEVKNLLIRKSGIDLGQLIMHTPLLQGLRLYHNHDDFNTAIWAQPSADHSKWSYPGEVLDILDITGLMLKTFEWNGRFPSVPDVLGTAFERHSRPAFAKLKDVTFLNLSLKDKATDNDFIIARDLLTASLQKLSNLQRLSFRQCAMLDDATISAFPLGLRHLEMSNCLSLTSTAVEKYMNATGSTIKSLRLIGNQSMSLGFMARLKALCPHLQTFEVDLSYTDPTSYRDRDPLYDELFPNGAPSWPHDLTTISMENLRQLSISDAEELFASLVESAEELPYLRKLKLKAILKEASWRDRAALRKTWLSKLQSVFLNTAVPSNMTQTAIKPSSSQRQSTRLAKLVVSESSDENEPSRSSGNAKHGRCDVVNLVISDQRPSQEQFHETDFLDEELSGDEEWNGRNEIQLSTRHAW